MMKDVLKREIAAYVYLAGEIGKIAVASQHVALDDVEAPFITLVSRRIYVPTNGGR